MMSLLFLGYLMIVTSASIGVILCPGLMLLTVSVTYSGFRMEYLGMRAPILLTGQSKRCES